MSPSQFPAQPPKNITLSVLNVLDPVPQQLAGTFDVIHLRLLILGLPKNTWEIACKNLLQLLKPGGWLQWEEANFA
jgi:chemotaxis methyl-accepting protein methylase